MTGEITRRNVLLECLEHFRGLKKLCSKEHKGLEPAEGEEDLFYMLEEKCRIMQELIQAYESEPVRKALADWKNEVMEKGPKPLDVDDLIPPRRPLFSQRQEAARNGHTAIYMPGDQEAWPVPGGENPGKL